MKGYLVLPWINGLKGLCAFWIYVFHFLLAFAPLGYVGWNCVPTEAEKYDYYFSYFPYSLVTNSDFALYVFFGLIAFIPGVAYFKNHDEAPVKRQALIRYFRFLPPILLACALTWLTKILGLEYAEEAAALLQNNWLMAIQTTSELDLPLVLYDAFIGAYLFGSNYISVLWCINIIFFGSYLSYGVILFCGEAKRRSLIYLLLIAATYYFPFYAVFIGGVFAADIYVNGSGEGKGWLWIMVGLLLGHVPAVWLPAFLPAPWLFGIGATFFLMGCFRLEAFRKLLEGRLLQWLGRYSFAIILVHFVILKTFSSLLVVKLFTAGYGMGFVLPAVFAGTTLLVLPLAVCFDRVAIPLTKELVGKVEALFI